MRRLGSVMDRVKGWWLALLAPAPDPRQTLADAVARQRELLGRVRLARDELAAARRQLESQVLSMLGALGRLEESARQALVAGREDRARLALERRWVVTREMRVIEDQARELGREAEQLTLAEERLATRIAAFDARHQALAARTSAADAQARIAEALTGLSTELDDLAPSLDEAERKAERSQARAAAIEWLVESGSLETVGLGAGDALQQGIAELDRARAIDEQISRLRRESGQGG